MHRQFIPWEKYVTFKEEQKFSKKELKKLSKNFEIETECEIIDFNNKKIEERARYENREKSFQMVIDDVYAISKGTLIGRPRNK